LGNDRMLPTIKNFLLTGRPGIGKTTVAEAVIREFEEDAGGFVTGEIRESGTRKGFRITTVDGAMTTLAHVGFSSPLKVGKYGVDLETLRSIALPSVRTGIKQKQVIVIDEIGRMELASKEFRTAVLEALNSNRVVVATIQRHAEPFTDLLKKRHDVKLIEVTVENRHQLPRMVAELVNAALQKPERAS
jgi:nucleoside-triphosphatase